MKEVISSEKVAEPPRADGSSEGRYMTKDQQSVPQKPPERVWVFQLPDGHWEVRWEDPFLPHAREYKAVTP